LRCEALRPDANNDEGITNPSSSSSSSSVSVSGKDAEDVELDEGEAWAKLSEE
jgi:hypothetical protein